MKLHKILYSNMSRSQYVRKYNNMIYVIIKGKNERFEESKKVFSIVHNREGSAPNSGKIEYNPRLRYRRHQSSKSRKRIRIILLELVIMFSLTNLCLVG